MAERQLLTIEKIPLRLSLQYLSAAETLTHSARNFFSSRNRHPMHHPLMHQIGANPDCRALAICEGVIPQDSLIKFFDHGLDGVFPPLIFGKDFRLHPLRPKAPQAFRQEVRG